MFVHSWIFRNRARLRLIYGTPTPAVSLPSDEVRPEHLPMGVEARVEGPLAPPSAAGMVQERARDVILTPMPRRAS